MAEHDSTTRSSRTNLLARRALLSLWGTLTLLLMIAVSLLGYEMFKEGRSPLDISLLEGQRWTQESTPTREETATTGDVILYFADPSTVSLLPERRRIVLTSQTVENCRNALEALIDGPREALAPVISPRTSIRGMYILEGGELVVDFSREVEAGHIESLAAEMLMMRSIVASLSESSLRGTDSERVSSVRFLFEGSPPSDSFPVHIDLTSPIRPDPSWTNSESRTQADV